MNSEGLTFCYDGKRAVANMTGLGNYSRRVIDVLSARFDSNRYVMLSSVHRDNQRLAPLLSRHNVSITYPSGAARLIPALWRSGRGIVNAARREGATLFHGLAGELPHGIMQSGIKSVVTIHDLIFNRYPQGYKPLDRIIYDAKARHACTVADRIIAISERTRDDIVEYYDIDPSRIDVVYQGCDDIYSLPMDEGQIKAATLAHGLTTPYFITVGTVEERKNQLLAVKAIQQMPAGVSLAIVGRFRGRYGAEVERYIKSNNLSSRVHHLTGISLQDLALLTAGACGSIYISRYEGFGLPVIEALSAGTPVIAATGSCLEEAGGPGAIYIDPDDIDGLFDAMKTLISNRDKSRRMVLEGREYVKRFDGSCFADSIMAVYHKALTVSK